MSNKVLRMINFKLYIMRHGQTNGNVLNLSHGVTDEPLNDTGRAQAKLAGAALSSVPFSHAYSSDLSRARETAQIVLGQGAWGDRPHTTDPRLREQNFGSWEARPVKELKAELVARGIRSGLFHNLPADAETTAAMRARVTAFFTGLCEGLCGEGQDSSTVLVVSHGLAITELLAHLNTLSCEPLPPLPHFPNTGYCVCAVRCSAEACEVDFETRCQHSHLEGMPSL